MTVLLKILALQSCLRHHLRLPTLPSTPTLSQAESSGSEDRRYLRSIPTGHILGTTDSPIQPAHDPDYVPEPIYPRYIPLEHEHEFLAEEQLLPHVDSPIVGSPEYVTESDPEEDPEEYEDDETKDGPVTITKDGEYGDNDEGNVSGDERQKMRYDRRRGGVLIFDPTLLLM
ncbi:hypothetical protein Tco_0282330 [Tanacetum coccineum]